MLFANSIEAEGVIVQLKDWNNNQGVEFDILQDVFPSRIPKSTDFIDDVSVETKIMSISALVLFVSVAIQVDASFDVRDSSGELLAVHDGCILIETSNSDFKNSWVSDY